MPGQTQRVGGSISPAHSQPGARRIWKGSTTILQLNPRERPPAPMFPEAVLASGQLCMAWKISAPQGFDSWKFQPIA